MSRYFKQHADNKFENALRCIDKVTLCLLLFWFLLVSGTVRADLSIADLSVELSPQAQEAIDNGVSMTINCEFANIEDILFFKRATNKKMHHFTLSRHTLSNRYIVKRDNLSRPYMFRTISEAINFISSQAVDLLESYSVFDSQRKMRISLNKFELPGPMRLQAFIFDEWDLDTGWLAWNFER